MLSLPGSPPEGRARIGGHFFSHGSGAGDRAGRRSRHWRERAGGDCDFTGRSFQHLWYEFRACQFGWHGYFESNINGKLPTVLFGVCVSVGGVNAPLLGVYPGQINAVAPDENNFSGFPPGASAPYTGVLGSTEVVVITGCGTSTAAQSVPQIVAVQTAAPEFLYFANNTHGQNPVAAINSVTGAYVGPASLGPNFVPAHPGGVITIFASGFGPSSPAIPAGTVAPGAASAANPVVVTLGSVILDSSNVLYAGAAPGELISQLNIRIPSGTPAGNLPIQIQIAGISSPPGAFVAIAVP
jgi:uncharacterized protein (TIGR03437 family)